MQPVNKFADIKSTCSYEFSKIDVSSSELIPYLRVKSADPLNTCLPTSQFQNKSPVSFNYTFIFNELLLR